MSAKSLIVYQLRGNGRSQRMAQALVHGGGKAGYRVTSKTDGDYIGVEADVAAFYGYQKNLPMISQAYIDAGKKVVFVDLGYWGRLQGGRWAGYHKIVVNGRHPSPELLARPRSADRWRRWGLSIEDWKTGGSDIIVAGMSAKAAESCGYAPEQWERETIRELARHTQRRIVYRPKPSWPEAKPIGGSLFDKRTPLELALSKAWAVVSHHSNVAVDGLIKGVPAWCWDGAAYPMASHDLARIEAPYRPEGRHEWLHALAWCQWNTAEIRNGDVFRFLRDDGQIP